MGEETPFYLRVLAIILNPAIFLILGATLYGIVYYLTNEEPQPVYFYGKRMGEQRLPIHVGMPEDLPLSGSPPPFVAMVPLGPFGVPEWFNPRVLYMLRDIPLQVMVTEDTFVGQLDLCRTPTIFIFYDIPIEALIDYDYDFLLDRVVIMYDFTIANNTLYVWPEGLNIGNMSDRALLVLGLSRALYVVKLVLLDLIEVTRGEDLLLSDIPNAKVLSFTRFYVRGDLAPANASLAIIYGAKMESFSPHVRSHIWRYTVDGSSYYTIIAAIIYGMEGEDNYYKVALDNTTLLEKRLKVSNTILEETTISIEPGQHTANTTIKLASVLHYVLEYR